MSALVVGFYELGRQPFGVAHATARLREAGVPARALDLARQRLSDGPDDARLLALCLPMHTATRIAIDVLPRLRARFPRARVVAFGLYARLNEQALRDAGVDDVLGPEAEDALVAIARGEAPDVAPLPRVRFTTPARDDLAPLSSYVRLVLPDGSERTAGYVEATRGCKHACRHCPVVPVYGARFFAVPRAQVLADVAQQVEAGAEHVTFGDPDFLNGPTHALRVARELHASWPDLTFDATVKVEHLRAHEDLLPELRALGLVLLTTAAESLDDRALAILDKRHARVDFERALAACREADIAVNPTWLPFAPWVSLDDVVAFWRGIAALDLVGATPPVQYAIRLLLPSGSLLLERPEVAPHIDGFSPRDLAWTWRHPDPLVDELHARVVEIAEAAPAAADRHAFFPELFRLAEEVTGQRWSTPPVGAQPRATIPYLNEPWYC